jgi:transposase
MPRTRPRYPPESVVRRCAGALGRFAQAGRGRPGHVGADAACWRRQGDIDAGRAEGLTSDEREELRRPRRKNRRLSQEREISKAAAAFLRVGDRSPVMCFRLSNRREEVTACRLPAVQRARRQPGRLLRLEGPPGVGARAPRRRAAGRDRRDPRREQRHPWLAAHPCRAASPRRLCAANAWRG